MKCSFKYVPTGRLSPQTKFQDDRMLHFRETMVDPWILLTDLCGSADLTLITKLQLFSISATRVHMSERVTLCVPVSLHSLEVNGGAYVDGSGDIEKSKSRMRFSKVSWVAGPLEAQHGRFFVSAMKNVVMGMS